jgi:hypothetical protein
MLTQEFALILKTEPDEEQADQLYERFQDGTISTTAGVTRIDFHREAESLVEAIRSAIRDADSVGFEVARIEIEPAAVAIAAT